jgi:hypothetical protein
MPMMLMTMTSDRGSGGGRMMGGGYHRFGTWHHRNDGKCDDDGGNGWHHAANLGRRCITRLPIQLGKKLVSGVLRGFGI